MDQILRKAGGKHPSPDLHAFKKPGPLYLQGLKRDQFDVIKGVVREVKMDRDGFISVVLYSSYMFSETFS